ncbi:MAG TPA: copper chaperone PCu(A)C [Streptosporangiaceae bacterium]
MATLALSGCTSPGSAKIATNSAYIPQPTTPGTTVAYMDIRNNGKTADRLVAATTSVGGQVSFLAPDGMSSSGTMIMKTVQDISIASQAIVRMNPNSFRLRITGAGKMQGGKDIIITLRFAHAGKVTVVALVTNPSTGGGSYFLN